MRESVRPVLADHDDQQREHRRRPGGHRAGDVELTHPEERDHRHHHGDEQADRDQDVVDEQVGQVGEEAPPEHLLGSEREDLLEGHEEQEQHRDARDAGAPGQEGDEEGDDRGQADGEAAGGGPAGVSPAVGVLGERTSAHGGSFAAALRCIAAS